MLQARHNNRSILDNTPKSPITLHHEIRRKIQPTTVLARIRLTVRCFRIVRDDGNVVPPTHDLAVLTSLTGHISLEDLHHVLFRVRRLRRRGSIAIGGDIERLVAVVEELDDVRRRRTVDYRRRDELVHRLVVRGVSGIVHQTCATDVDGAREERHAQGLLVRYSLESANKIRPLQVLRTIRAGKLDEVKQARREYIPLIHVSIGLSTRRGCRILQTGSEFRP